MEITSAASIAIAVRLVGQQLASTWRDNEETPSAVEELYALCRQYFGLIQNTVASFGNVRETVENLLAELADLRASYSGDPTIEDDIAMLLDAVRLGLAEDLSVKDFVAAE